MTDREALLLLAQMRVARARLVLQMLELEEVGISVKFGVLHPDDARRSIIEIGVDHLMPIPTTD